MRSGKLQWFYVHRLMAYSWLGPQPHPLRNIIDHIDGDSLNNSIQNLRWVTATGNQLNKKCHGIFEQDGKLHALYPAYDAFETFLFVPNHTSSSGTHIKDSIDLKRTMVMVIIALLPCLLFGMWNTGFQYHSQLTPGVEGYQDIYTFWDHFLFGSWKVLPLIIVSYVVGLSVEFAFAVSRKHQVNEGYLVTGMLIPLIMPIDVPLWMLALSVIFAVVIGKEVFGGTGMNILNPALTARAFIFFAYGL